MKPNIIGNATTIGLIAILVAVYLGGCTTREPLPAESTFVGEGVGSINQNDGASSYAGKSESLLARYSCNEGFGKIAQDNTSNAFDLRLAGEITWASRGVDDLALQFHRSGAARSRDPEMMTTLHTLRYGTISLWFYYVGRPAGQEISPLLYFGEDEERERKNYVVIEIGHPDNEYLYFTIEREGRLVQCFDSNVTIEKNRWSHFAAVVSPEGNTGYLNGVELTDRHYNFGTPRDNEYFASVAAPDMFALGFGTTGIADGFRFYDGALDEILLFDRPLSSSEILEIYQSSPERFAP